MKAGGPAAWAVQPTAGAVRAPGDALDTATGSFASKQRQAAADAATDLGRDAGGGPGPRGLWAARGLGGTRPGGLGGARPGGLLWLDVQSQGGSGEGGRRSVVGVRTQKNRARGGWRHGDGDGEVAGGVRDFELG